MAGPWWPCVRDLVSDSHGSPPKVGPRRSTRLSQDPQGPRRGGAWAQREQDPVSGVLNTGARAWRPVYSFLARFVLVSPWHREAGAWAPAGGLGRAEQQLLKTPGVGGGPAVSLRPPNPRATLKGAADDGLAAPQPRLQLRVPQNKALTLSEPKCPPGVVPGRHGDPAVGGRRLLGSPSREEGFGFPTARLHQGEGPRLRGGRRIPTQTGGQRCGSCPAGRPLWRPSSGASRRAVPRDKGSSDAERTRGLEPRCQPGAASGSS